MKQLEGLSRKIIQVLWRDIKTYKPVAIIFIVFGMFFLSLGIGVVISNLHYLDKTLSAVGTVFDSRLEPQVSGSDQDDQDYNKIYRVRFFTNTGEPTIFTDTSTYPRVGKQVQVRYFPDNPSNARIYNVSAFWVAPTLISLVGAPIFIFGLCGLVVKLKSQKSIVM
jgi:hypothetical protein